MKRLRAPFLVTLAAGATWVSGCSSSDGAATSATTDQCPTAEPTGGGACTGDPTGSFGALNHGCDFSHSCGTQEHYDALYVCSEGKWRRTHSNGCNPPYVVPDTGPDEGLRDADAQEGGVMDAADAAKD